MLTDYFALIIAYRRRDLVQNVLSQLSAQSSLPSGVVIVDNGGDLPGDVAATGPLADRTAVISRPDNPGYAAAVNIAWRRAAEQGVSRLLVLTHDAEFPPQLSERLGEALDQRPDAGAAAPVLRWGHDASRIFSAGGRLTSGGRAFNVVDPPKTVLDVDWVDGAIVLYRHAALAAIGGVDERYFLYFEDVDTAWAMRRAGWVTVVAPVRAAQHPGAHPPYLGIRNMTLFAQKAGIPTWRSALAVTRRMLEESAVAVLRRRLPPVRQMMRGWRDGRRGVDGRPHG